MATQEQPTGTDGETILNPRPWLGWALRLALVCIGLALLCVGLYQIPAVRHWWKGIEKQEADWPTYRSFTLRQSLIELREGARARGDLESAAMIEAGLSQEALRRVRALQQAWMTLRHPDTKLFPQMPQDPEWNYRNTAADFFCFQLEAALQLNPADVPALAETLAAERALAPAGELCQPVNSSTGDPLSVDAAERMFASSEYVKDGLLGVMERHGAAPSDLPIAQRLREVTTAILDHSEHQSKAGLILGTGAEEIGNMLQVCSRLSFALAQEDPEYAQRLGEYAAVLAEAVLFEMLPANNGWPALEFDFEDAEVIDAEVHLRDHGNEVFPGLAEAYAMAVARHDDPMWDERADRWAEPLAQLYTKLLAHGLNEDGLFADILDPESGRPIDDQAVDNWGYLLDGVLLYVEAARRHGVIEEERLAALEQGTDEVIGRVIHQYGLAWEGGSMDGYCDAIESALYMMHHRPQSAPLLGPWVDDQIGLLFDRQRPDGFIGRHYLDGNFIRTALMYADCKSGGFRVEPWREDVAVGFAREGDRAVVVVTSRGPYEGRLIADRARHREHMNLPWDWPRINSSPEWFVPTAQMQVVRAEGLATPPDAQAVSQGIELSLPANGRAVLEFNTSADAP